MNTDIILLDLAEQKIAKFLAKERYNSNRNSKVINAKIGPQSDEFTDLNGICGELAFCKIMNIYPDLDISPRKGTSDCSIPEMGTVDVKTTHRPNGRLLVRKSKNKETSNIFVLMTGTLEAGYIYRGYCLASTIFEERNLIDLGYGPTYGLTQDKLFSGLPVW